jgi:hypothetical protein
VCLILCTNLSVTFRILRRIQRNVIINVVYWSSCTVPLCTVPLCTVPLCTVPLCTVPLCLSAIEVWRKSSESAVKWSEVVRACARAQTWLYYCHRVSTQLQLTNIAYHVKYLVLISENFNKYLISISNYFNSHVVFIHLTGLNIWYWCLRI